MKARAALFQVETAEQKRKRNEEAKKQSDMREKKQLRLKARLSHDLDLLKKRNQRFVQVAPVPPNHNALGASPFHSLNKANHQINLLLHEARHETDEVKKKIFDEAPVADKNINRKWTQMSLSSFGNVHGEDNESSENGERLQLTSKKISNPF